MQIKMIPKRDLGGDEVAPLLAELPRMIENLREIREQILSTAVLLAEIPSPTFGEEERVRFVLDRLRENGLQWAEIDSC